MKQTTMIRVPSLFHTRLLPGLLQLAPGPLVLSLIILTTGVANATPGDKAFRPATTLNLTDTLVTGVSFTTVPDSNLTSNTSVQLFEASDGFIYGPKRQQNTYGENLYRIPASGGSIEVLGAFPAYSGGCHPSTPVEASDGNLYGVVADCGANHLGALYRMGQDGSIVLLYSFAGWPDGAYPIAPLIVGRDGFLYGLTSNYGGSVSVTSGGTFFRTDLAGHVTVLHTFTENGSGEPLYPRFPLVQARDGNFYGVSQYGGAFGLGAVFKLNAAGQSAVLYSFSHTPAEVPAGGLVEGADGALYGLTERGGTLYRGSAYRITPQGAYSVLVELPAGPSGAMPSGQLLLASDGNFYGVTAYTNVTPKFRYGDGEGVVFRISPTGEYRVIHYFDRSHPHRPVSGVMETSAGTLMGVTTYGAFWNENPSTPFLSLFTIENWQP